jgi:RNA polymerase sigma-70 factor (ECF subfamily)
VGDKSLKVGEQPSDGDLVRRTLAGEERAFEVLVHRHGRLVFRIIRGILPGAEVEDIAQEVFVKTYRSLGQLRSGFSLRPWLARLSTTVCYDYLRGRQRRKEVTFTELSREEGKGLAMAIGEVVDPPTLREEDRSVSRDLAEKLLSRLAPKDRAAVLLRELEGFSMADLARALGCSELAARLRLFRARRTLKAIFDREERREGGEGTR